MAHRPTVLITDPVHPDGVELLKQEADVIMPDYEGEDGLIAAAKDVDVILLRAKGRLTGRVLESCPRLRCVARYGVGLDLVDLPAATRLGIPVIYAPGVNRDSVAEHTLTLMLATSKHLFRMDASLRDGKWRDDIPRNIRELKGQTLGIIGVGNIGTCVARIAGAFGMTVLGCDPYVSAEELARRGARAVGMPELLKVSDIITVHTPLTDETRGMINERVFELMKSGAIFINTSRGPVVDERALIDALRSGKLAAAGLDVFEEEPLHRDNPLLNLPNVIVTPHVAGLSENADRGICLHIAEQILMVLRGDRPTTVGNPELYAGRR